MNDYEKEKVEAINVRCPHPETAIKMIECIKGVKKDNDSIGGTIVCVCRNIPPGLGEPCFDKVSRMEFFLVALNILFFF